MQDHSGESGGVVASQPGTERLRRLAPWARLAIAWERLWPPIVAVLCLAALFLIVSWLGLWLDLPPLARIFGVSVFAIALIVLLVRAARTAVPTPAEALARLDRDSGQRHRPASALSDALANAGADPATRALWQLHQRRLQAAAARLRLSFPAPAMAARDRFALRAAVILALVGAGFLAGPEKFARLASAFAWDIQPVAAKGFRIDAWIDPPPYTAKPPILLPVDFSGNADPSIERGVSAPVGSTLVVRASGDSVFAVEADAGLTIPKPVKKADAPTADSKKPAPGDREQRWILSRDAKLVLKRDDQPVARFAIQAIADQPPTILLNGLPTANARGSLTLSYTIHDDYGVKGAEAALSKPYLHGKPVTGRSLVEAPKITLGLPDAPGGLGTGQTTAELSDHPWAGGRVTMVLSARDEGGNTGESPPATFVLPQRPFVNPLAKALVEQRRDIILAPDDRAPVVAALDGLLLAPDLFAPPPSIYLGLYTADTRLKNAKTDDDLRGVADLLWSMAVRIEDGDLSGAERDLRAAEKNLRDAMQRGASAEEIAKLSKELRAALDKFLAQMAEKAARDRKAAAPGHSPSRIVTPRELQSMLDKLDQMARSGDLADAQRMLDQLQGVLENLRNTGRNASSDPMSQAMEQSLNELDQMTRDQQKLRDDTFRDDQRAKRERRERRRQELQNGQQPDIQGDDDEDSTEADQADPKGAQEFRDRQEALGKKLDDLRQRMKQFGMNKEQGLDDAQDAMSEAGKSLRQGQRGNAVEAQGRALDALRRGAQGFAQQMQNGEPSGRGNGQAEDDRGDDGSGSAQGNREADRDPLDRPTRDRRSLMGGQLNAGESLAQRAQQVLDELRKRLSDPSRPQEEMDYLERLLRHY